MAWWLMGSLFYKIQGHGLYELFCVQGLEKANWNCVQPWQPFFFYSVYLSCTGLARNLGDYYITALAVNQSIGCKC